MRSYGVDGNPDIRWLGGDSDMAALSDVQVRSPFCPEDRKNGTSNLEVGKEICISFRQRHDDTESHLHERVRVRETADIRRNPHVDLVECTLHAHPRQHEEPAFVVAER